MTLLLYAILFTFFFYNYAVVLNTLPKTLLDRRGCILKKWLLLKNPSKTDLGRNTLSKTLLGHKRLHAQKEAVLISE
jgi:hypothetical protein